MALSLFAIRVNITLLTDGGQRVTLYTVCVPVCVCVCVCVCVRYVRTLTLYIHMYSECVCASVCVCVCVCVMYIEHSIYMDVGHSVRGCVPLSITAVVRTMSLASLASSIG